MELFNIFFEFEEKGSKGAIRYLIKSMNKIRIPKKEGGLYSRYQPHACAGPEAGN